MIVVHDVDFRFSRGLGHGYLHPKLSLGTSMITSWQKSTLDHELMSLFEPSLMMDILISYQKRWVEIFPLDFALIWRLLFGSAFDGR